MSLERLERACQLERRGLQRTEGALDVLMLGLDALTFMLVFEALLLPVCWLSFGDLILIVLYAGAFSLIAFVAFFGAFIWLVRKEADRRQLLDRAEAELAEMKKARKTV